MATETENTYDNLIAGPFDRISERSVLISGQNLTRGAALGKITASGYLTQLDSGAADGSENAYSILQDDTDATSGNLYCTNYLSGEFNRDEVGFVTGDAYTDYEDAFRALSIFLKPAQESV